MQLRYKNIRLWIIGIVAILLLTGCSISYYWQAATGHLALMRKAEPVEAVIASDQTVPELRDKLVDAMAAVAFAHEQLLLPDNGSYASYADLDRRYAVWNVVAAPPLSLEPRSWCFPVAGCVSYRGYFSPDGANAFAEKLRSDGDDVFVGGVAAYSTLGRFSDPLLNTVMHLPDYRLTGIIFHELAHQKLYVRDDSQFNEGFASFIEAEGVRRWLLQQNDVQVWCRYQLEERREDQVLAMLGDFRLALAELFAQQSSDAAKLEAKAALLATIDEAYDDLKQSWQGPPDFDHWFATPFNNARFAMLSTYDHDVPAFAALLAQTGGDLEAFYQHAAELAAEPADERRVRLDALRTSGIQKKSVGEESCADLPVPGHRSLANFP